jgi:hypothetical protein
VADLKISALTAGGASQATDEYVVARASDNRKITGANIAAAATAVGTLTSGAIGAGFTAIPNTALANSSITINGTPVSLGGSTTVSASAAGSNTQVQFNSSGSLAGDSGFVFDSTNKLLTLGLAGTSTGTLTLANNASSADARLTADANNVLAQRKTTSAQTFRVYNTFTDASNYERFAIQSATYSGGKYTQLAVESAGTGAANQNLVLSVRNAGAIMLQIPDGTASGGNARGQYAIDFSMGRTNAINVASGDYSFVAASSEARATGTRSVAFSNSVASGTGAFAAAQGQASGNFSAAFGPSSLASGTDSFAGAGSTASGQGAVAFAQATASGSRSIAFGLGASADKVSQFVLGARGGTTQITGYQSSVMNLLTDGTVTSSSATTLTLEGVSAIRPTIPANTTWAVRASILGRTRNGVSNAMFLRQLIIKRDGANSTTLVGSVQTVGTDIKTDTDLDLSVAITADDTNEALQVNVTGKMGGTVSSLTSSGTTCTLTSTANHGLQTGDYITIAGAVQTAYNGTFTITRTGATTFTYTAASTPSATPATGTITANISCRWLCKLDCVEIPFPA